MEVKHDKANKGCHIYIIMILLKTHVKILANMIKNYVVFWAICGRHSQISSAMVTNNDGW